MPIAESGASFVTASLLVRQRTDESTIVYDDSFEAWQDFGAMPASTSTRTGTGRSAEASFGTAGRV